jgi:hypothetical protein
MERPEEKQYRATSERSRSVRRIKFVGLDVHAETLAIAVAEQEEEIRSLGMIPNREEAVRWSRNWGRWSSCGFVMKAGPTGYMLYWQLTKMAAAYTVVAPTLVPVKAGDRVKTDRRDALKPARNSQPALVVRGRSRRITIMRFRPANIRVINRRHSFFDRDPRFLLKEKERMKKER